MTTLVLSPPGLPAGVVHDEQVMQELLQAAHVYEPAGLSPDARTAIEHAGSMLAVASAGWPAVCCHAARFLRERCIRLGIPRTRYLTGEWINRGL